jgi:hypothetical protein
MAAEQFNYFSEIEERFCQRRGTAVMLSTLDWSLIETWKEAGIPLAAVLRGIDEAFDRYNARPRKTRRVNSLAYCAQQVLTAAEEMSESAVGAERATGERAQGLEAGRIAAYLEQNAAAMETAAVPDACRQLSNEMAGTLRGLAVGIKGTVSSSLEDVERRLTVMEEKLFSSLMTATADEELVGIRAEADRELAPYRRKLNAPQIEHLLKQYQQKKLLERYHVPRLSLFYM